MEQIGYHLVDGQGTVLEQWGGIFGQCPAAPNPLVLPNGDQICAPSVDTDYGGFQLKAWLAEEPLADVKTKAKVQISRDAEAARGKYLTPGSLKAMSYLKVAQEATTYVATQGAGNYPLLQARVASGRYADLATAAAATIAIEDATTTAAAAIDTIEDRAKLLIDAAATADDVRAALLVTWP